MAIRRVPGTYASIQEAADASNPGDTVLVAASYVGYEYVFVTVDNLTFNVPNAVEGIELYADGTVTSIKATGGSDIRFFGTGSDETLTGNAGENYISSGGGMDIIDGGAGDDFIQLGSFAGKATGGADDDTFLVNGGTGTVNGGTGTDTVRLQSFDLGALSFAAVEILDAHQVAGTVAQISSFASIVDSSSDAIQIQLRGAGGAIDFSNRLTEGDRLVVYDSGLTGGIKVTGTSNADFFSGSRYADVFEGGAGADSFGASAGRDTLRGGAGDDRFEVFGGSGSIDGGQDVDTVFALDLGNYTFSNVENLEIAGYLVNNNNFSASATQLSSFSTIRDVSGFDQIRISLNGAGGAIDFSSRVASGQTLRVTAEDVTAGVAVTGSVNDDFLRGSDFDDRLDGSGGADTLLGGQGDDVYTVDALDTIAEAANFGNDSVFSSVSWTLGANFENLTLTGTAAIDGTGNALANLITGNDAANLLDGGGGGDTLVGGLGDDIYVTDGGDTITEAANAGTDLVRSSATVTLGVNLENLTLIGTTAIDGTGNGGANTITGNDAANVLDGGGGADRLVGGLGNDTYILDGGDNVVETSAAGGGLDTVRSSVSITLNANIEDLVLTGTANIYGAGNTANNAIVGNTGANILTGYAGTDQLTGGLGADTFMFRALADSSVATAGRDLIRDFSQAQGDRINLSLIDANAATGANDAFTFIGASEFSGSAGQLRAVTVGSITTVSGDVNGDAVADFAINVNRTAFVAGDFVL